MHPHHPIPRDDRFDSSLALWRDPYRFIGKQCQAFGADLFETRLLLQPTICMTGPVAGKFFYDPKHFQRQGAAPEPVQATLFGKGSAQTLDSSRHRRRKGLFMQVLGDRAVADLTQQVRDEWKVLAASWTVGQRVPLYEAAQTVLMTAVCRWAGVPLPPEKAEQRTRDMVALFDEAARGGLHHLHARSARWRLEAWLSDWVQAVRAGNHRPRNHAAIATMAAHQDVEGDVLPPRVAAVELLNVLRPTVAVSVFIVFAAHALHEHPQWRASLSSGDPRVLPAFLQEIRRHYPFFPTVTALLRDDVHWHGFHLRKGRRVLFDLYGTNHDSRTWEAPDQFRPERFLDHTPGRFEFVPQGGAEPQTHHRCPGEGLTLALMEVALDFLLRGVQYTVLPADLRLDFNRLPALPREPLVLQIQGLGRWDRPPGSA